MKTVVAMYRTMHQAEAALQALFDEGVPRDRISFTAPRATGLAGRVEAHDADNQPQQGVRDERGERTAIGATFGGVGGLLAGIIAFSIPGIGPAIGLGPLAVAVAGTAMGTVGGIIGALVGRGIPRSAARVMEEGLVSGYVLVGVDEAPDEVKSIENVLARFDPVDIGVGDTEDVEPLEDLRGELRGPLDTTASASSADVGYDEAVQRVQGVPDRQTYSMRSITVEDSAEDRYDEASDPGVASTGDSGFGRTLGAETSLRDTSARSGDLNASSDLGLTVVSGTTSDEALEPASDVRVLPVGDEELVPPRMEVAERGEVGGERAPERADDDLDVNLRDEVIHGEVAPEPVAARPEDAERPSTMSRPSDAREGVEPDEDRLPSPTGR